MGYKVIPGTQQPDPAIPVWMDFFKTRHIDKIIELGSGSGVFSLMMNCLSGAPVVSFDLKNHNRSINNVHFIEADIYKNPDLIIDELCPRCLLLCDGGDKKLEFELFGPKLQRGCYIAIHDYFDSMEDFYLAQSEGIWDWCNCHSICTDGYDRIYKDKFRKSAWGVWKKNTS